MIKTMATETEQSDFWLRHEFTVEFDRSRSVEYVEDVLDEYWHFGARVKDDRGSHRIWTIYANEGFGSEFEGHEGVESVEIRRQNIGPTWHRSLGGNNAE